MNWIILGAAVTVIIAVGAVLLYRALVAEQHLNKDET